VGLVGLGNIGQHVLDRLLALGTTVLAIEPDAARAARAAERGVRMYALDDKATFLAQPMDALVVNARGGTLDLASAHLVAGNARCRIVCGCENLAMPDATAADVLRHAHTAWFPTEFGGMMGYLTAAEEYLCAKAGAAFDVQALFDAAARLEDAGREITKRWLATAFEAPFARVAHEVFG
jgi:6-phosphogluconate dehydrogenase (decarboxylating)